MATRRQPASNMGKGRGASANSRPPSALSRTAGNDKERKTQLKENIDEAGSSIQVAIRSRRRSGKEVEEKSPVVVSVSKEPHSVTVELASVTSTFGVVSLPPTRTYSFDTVFGPEADQATVYQEVVAPMLEEVLQGYNCTLFAYGQTGTGKTYTMQGDLNLSPLGNPVANAGMMPRAIINLYQSLETSGADFSVKISYVELYNEELRDLLAHENPDQESTFSANESSSLKIYDDVGKRGVFIQGLEEVLVKDAAAAIRLLSQGSHKRQVAATKFNDHSSRSHAVFSITVHVRESSSIGDDLLRTGKLNLVDLAGSENIGRSGAENKRAREAGMINQSLLSLGRVINALVEKSSYIPYRESKLTRILQDSLGGRTKTTIIATISPAHSNIEETLSTLEYALRAKSIRNRPEVNQRMSRNALLKDYVTEIERLKADLVSAREKNGMYLSNETWDQLSLEKEQMQMESEAAKKECASINSQLNALREEFEQSLALLVKRDNELDRTKQTLNQRTQELGIAEESLKTLGKSLQIETSARQAYQRSESVLDGVAKNLKRAVQASVSDLEGVFSKLERNSQFLDGKHQSGVKAGNKIESLRNSMAAELDLCSTENAKFLGKIGTAQTELQELIEQFVTEHKTELMRQDNVVREALYELDEQEALESGVVAAALAGVRKILASSCETFDRATQQVQRIGEAIIDEVANAAVQNSTSVLNLLHSEHKSMSSTLADVQESLERYFTAVEGMTQSTRQSMETEKSRLKQQNELLQQQVKEIRSGVVVGRERFAKQLLDLVTAFSEEQMERVEATASSVDRANEKAFTTIGESTAHFDTSWKIAQADRSRVYQNIEGGLLGADRRQADNIEETERMKATIGHLVLTSKNELTTSLSDAHVDSLKRIRGHEETCCTELEELRALKKVRIENQKVSLRSSQEHIVSRGKRSEEASQSIHERTEAISEVTSQFSQHLDEHTNTARTALNSLRKVSHAIQDNLTTKLQSTGTTPRKRKWNYPLKWETVGSRHHSQDVGIPVLEDSPHAAQQEEGVSELLVMDTSDESVEPPEEIVSEMLADTLLPASTLVKKVVSKLPGPKERPPLNVVHNGIPNRLR